MSNSEYELKLVGGPKALDAVRKVLDSRFATKGRWRTKDLENTYFDTAELDLYKGHTVLRIRKNGNTTLETVKAADDDFGFISRGEWEVPVQNAAVDLNALPKSVSRRLEKLTRSRKLNPVFSNRVRRNDVVVDLPRGAKVEAALDRGEITVKRKKIEICECELELKAGSPAALFDLAAALQKEAGLKVEYGSKAGRAYEILLGNDSPVPVTIGKFTIDGDKTVSDALSLILRRNFKHMLDNEAVALEGLNPEGVHQMRLAIRQFRSGLFVFAKLIEKERVAWLHEEFRWLLRTLGPARDWDVFIDETLATIRGTGIDESALTVLRAEALKKRIRAYKDVRGALESPRYARLILKTLAFIETKGWSPENPPPSNPLLQPMNTVSAALLERPYKKACKSGGNLAELGVEQRHALRKKMKKLRNAAMFLHSLYGEAATKPFRKHLTKIHRQFGLLNDLSVSQDLIDVLVKVPQKSERRKVLMQRAAGIVMGWHAHATGESSKSLNADWAAFLDMTPFWRKAPFSARRKTAKSA